MRGDFKNTSCHCIPFNSFVQLFRMIAPLNFRLSKIDSHRRMNV